MKMRQIFLTMTILCLISTLLTSFYDKKKNGSPLKTYFPDENLASIVAERLGKTDSDNVTIEELASIKGEFGIGPGDTEDLTGIGYLTGIDTLYCTKNAVKEIPDEIGKLKNLVYLDFTKAFEVEKISPKISELKKLKKIRMSLMQLKVLPKEIGQLSELEFLSVCCNQLTEIPKEIGNLKKLQRLDIHSNDFGKLPDEICQLSSLKILDLSHCKLKSLPENIGNLSKLENLNLFNNDIIKMPQSISKLSNLTKLNIYDNFKLDKSYKNYLPEKLKKVLRKKN